jgi:hypothetical protein
LKKEIAKDIIFTEKTVDFILKELLKTAKIETIINPAITEVIPFINIKKGENIHEVITQLLFELGYTFTFNPSGSFIIVPLFDYNGNPSHIFDGTNCREEIVQTANAKRYDSIVANWNKVEYKTNVLLFRDPSNEIEIAGGSYLFGETTNILNYDNELGTVLLATAAKLTSPLTSAPNISIKVSENTGLGYKLSAINNSGTPYKFKGIEVYGDAYISTATNQTKSTNNLT